MREAFFWEKKDDGKIQCQLCPHHCSIANNQLGICRVRKAIDGKLYSLYDGQIATGRQIDPIEKKPLYHFYPGSKVLSFGGISCNLKCDHCQNCHLSQEYHKPILATISDEQIVQMALTSKCKGVAWTYNEPTIHWETYYRWSKLLHERGLYTIWVSNGYINPKPLEKLAGCLDAVNFDVKAFSDQFYQRYTKSRLQPVLDSCILAQKLGLHLELTYLVIPTLNDSMMEVSRYLDWIANNLGTKVPLHFTRFHPDYRMNHLPPTPVETVKNIVDFALERKFLYVYTGNLHPNPYNNTCCPTCHQVIIERSSFFGVQKIAITPECKCEFCGETIDVVV